MRRPETSALGLVAVLVVAMIGTTLPTSVYSRYEEQLGFGPATLGVVFAAYAVGVIAALLATGRWSDTVGRRPVLVGGLAVALLSDVVFVLAGSLPLLYVGRVLSGVSAGVFVGTASVYVVESAAGRLERHGSALASSANMAGLGLGPLVSAVLVAVAPAPLRTPYVVHAALVLLALVVLMRTPETVERSTPDLRPLKPALPGEVRGAFPRVALLAFAGFMVFGLITSLTPTVVAQVMGVTAPVPVALVLLLAFVGSIGSHQLTRGLAERPATLLSVGLLVVGMVLLAVSLVLEWLPLLALAVLLGGAGQGIGFGRGLQVLTSRAPSGTGSSVTSTYFVVAYVAISLPVVFAGLGVAGLGARAAGIGFALVVAALAAVSGALTLRQVPRD